MQHKANRSIFSIIIIAFIVGLVVTLSACIPAKQAPVIPGAPVVASQPSSVDWDGVANFYNKYVVGLASIGLGVAAAAHPEAAPAIQIAAKEVGNLNALLQAKAGDDDVQKQIAIIDKAIADADSKFVPVRIPPVTAAQPAAVPTTSAPSK